MVGVVVEFQKSLLLNVNTLAEYKKNMKRKKTYQGLKTQSRAPLIVVLEDEQVYVATHKQWCNMRSRAIMANAGSFSVTFFLGGPLCIRMSPINRTRNLLALFSNLRELHCWV